MFRRIWWDRGRMNFRTLILIIWLQFLICKWREEEAGLVKKRRMRLGRIFCCWCDIDHFTESFFAQTDCCRSRASLLKRRSEFKWRSCDLQEKQHQIDVLLFPCLHSVFCSWPFSGAYSQVPIQSESKTDRIRKINKRSNLSSELSECFKKDMLGMFILPEVV